jgi:hypothetical protein
MVVRSYVDVGDDLFWGAISRCGADLPTTILDLSLGQLLQEAVLTNQSSLQPFFGNPPAGHQSGRWVTVVNAVSSKDNMQ